MDLIYSLSEATLIAVASKDPFQPLPGCGNVSRPRLERFRLGKKDYIVIPHPQIDRSVWNTTGCTFQEAVFSKRRIYFCANQVYFECRSAIHFESIQEGYGDAGAKGLAPHPKLGYLRRLWVRPSLFPNIHTQSSAIDVVYSLRD
jgi:hypothetical protein